MKVYHFAIICLLTVLTACNAKTDALIEHTSPNGKAKLTITANRPSAMDEWKVTMKVKAYDFKEGQLAFRAMAEDISNETVKFEWVDDNNCLITFTLRDDTQRKFQLIASPSQVQMAEI